MEGGTQHTDGQTTKLWLTNLEFAWEGETITEAEEHTREVIEFARSRGLMLCDGHTGRAREREPFESLNYGSDEPLRNMHARSEYENVAGKIASGAGARQHA